MVYYYSFTLSKVRGDRKLSDYEDYLDKLNLEVHNKVYEENKGLHVHCMIRSARRVTKKQCKLYPYGWSLKLIHLQTFSDIGAWIHYCLKHYEDNIYYKYHLEEMRLSADPDHLKCPSNSCSESINSTEVNYDSPDEDSLEKVRYPQFDIRKAVRSTVNEIVEKL